MRRTALIGVAVVALAVVAAFAAALPGYSINPSGTVAVVNGQLELVGDGTRAPLNVATFASMPASPGDGVFIVDGGPTHLLCFVQGGPVRCTAMILTP
jgi:hypothetical protein